jgi:hypothetical protein
MPAAVMPRYSDERKQTRFNTGRGKMQNAKHRRTEGTPVFWISGFGLIFDELVKRHQMMAKKNVRVQGVANPEE